MFIVADADDPSYLGIAGYVDVLTVSPDQPGLEGRLRLALTQLNYPEKAHA